MVAVFHLMQYNLSPKADKIASQELLLSFSQSNKAW